MVYEILILKKAKTPLIADQINMCEYSLKALP